MSSVYIFTLGCPKNTVASRRLEKALSKIDILIAGNSDEADALIVNTCGFIEAAKEESIEFLLKLGVQKQANPGQKLIAVGCLIQRYKDEITKAMPEVDYCLDFSSIRDISEILGASEEISLSDQAHAGEPTAYLEISYGCNQRCSFCSIPSITGAFRSRREEDILAEAESLSANGCKEVVLVGQDTGSYGNDPVGKTNLSKLANNLSCLDEIAWIRIMYLQPRQLSDDLIETIASNPKVCAYLDLPFQHASARIVKAMNRWGTSKMYLRLVEKLRAKIPDIAVRTSVMVGFPGETEKDIYLLAAFLRQAELDYVGIFEYSAEDGTPAAAFGHQISRRVKRKRWEQIKTVADEVAGRRRERFVGQELDVLIDGFADGSPVGRSQYQAPGIDGEVIVSGVNCRSGDIVRVRIESHEDYELTGRLI